MVDTEFGENGNRPYARRVVKKTEGRSPFLFVLGEPRGASPKGELKRSAAVRGQSPREEGAGGGRRLTTW